MKQNEIYLYHWVPRGMEGSILYPLNQLKSSHPEIYESHIKKYEGREKLLKREIPIINCLWNDVIHTTALTPAFVFGKLREAGFDYPTKKYFKIPVSSLDPVNLIVLLSKKDDDDGFQKTYELFNPENIEKYREFSNDTLEYYKEMKVLDKQPLVYHLVPHILYKGTIDTTNLEIIEE